MIDYQIVTKTTKSMLQNDKKYLQKYFFSAASYLVDCLLFHPISAFFLSFNDICPVYDVPQSYRHLITYFITLKFNSIFSLSDFAV